MEALVGIGFAQLCAIWLIVVFASVMRAFTGFGFALTAVPTLSLLMLPTQAVALSVLLTLAVSLLTIRKYWGKYPLRPIVPMVLCAVIGTALGTVLLGRVSPAMFQLGVGLSVILASAVLVFYRPSGLSGGPALSGATGLVSGLSNGLFAIPGPPIIIFAVATETQPERIRALLMTFFLFSASIALVTYSFAGIVTPGSGWMLLLALPAMLAGDKLGYFLFHRYGDLFYRRVALGVLFLVGIVTTARALL